MTAAALEQNNARIVECTRCPRLVAWREEAARYPPRRYGGERYWARPLPGFGDPAAKVLIVGLAPAAHGGNRTGRIFTGDRSGDVLFEALHRTGFANQPTSTHRDDGLRLRDAYIAAVNRCCPPGNLPTPTERANCRPYLVTDISALEKLTVLVCLGAVAWHGAVLALGLLGHSRRPRPAFGHAAEAQVGPFTLLGSYHPSQQNVFTGRLTPAMLSDVFNRSRQLAGLVTAA